MSSPPRIVLVMSVIFLMMCRAVMNLTMGSGMFRARAVRSASAKADLDGAAWQPLPARRQRIGTDHIVLTHLTSGPHTLLLRTADSAWALAGPIPFAVDDVELVEAGVAWSPDRVASDIAAERLAVDVAAEFDARQPEDGAARRVGHQLRPLPPRGRRGADVVKRRDREREEGAPAEERRALLFQAVAIAIFTSREAERPSIFMVK